MIIKNSKSYTFFLSLFVAFAVIMPFISSCGKGGQASSVGLNTQIEVLNLSPDLAPVNLYITFLSQGTGTYYYSINSGYFFVNSLDTPMQVRTASTTTSTINLLTIDTTLLANHKYSLFITGLYTTDSLTYILTRDDTAKTPRVGFGKLRFVNASLPRTNLNITVNGTLDTTFTAVPYKKVTNYVQLPAGIYTFQVSPTNSPATILPTPGLTNITIQDSRLYTLYTNGIVGRTDSSAFAGNVITNR